jgi:hypothetical protein
MATEKELNEAALRELREEAEENYKNNIKAMIAKISQNNRDILSLQDANSKLKKQIQAATLEMPESPF